MRGGGVRLATSLQRGLERVGDAAAAAAAARGTTSSYRGGGSIHLSTAAARCPSAVTGTTSPPSPLSTPHSTGDGVAAAATGAMTSGHMNTLLNPGCVGVLTASRREDVRLMTTSFTAFELAAGLTEREYTLHLCATLLERVLEGDEGGKQKQQQEQEEEDEEETGQGQSELAAGCGAGVPHSDRLARILQSFLPRQVEQRQKLYAQQRGRWKQRPRGPVGLYGEAKEESSRAWPSLVSKRRPPSSAASGASSTTTSSSTTSLCSSSSSSSSTSTSTSMGTVSCAGPVTLGPHLVPPHHERHRRRQQRWHVRQRRRRETEIGA